MSIFKDTMASINEDSVNSKDSMGIQDSPEVNTDRVSAGKEPQQEKDKNTEITNVPLNDEIDPEHTEDKAADINTTSDSKYTEMPNTQSIATEAIESNEDMSLSGIEKSDSTAIERKYDANEKINNHDNEFRDSNKVSENEKCKNIETSNQEIEDIEKEHSINEEEVDEQHDTYDNREAIGDEEHDVVDPAPEVPIEETEEQLGKIRESHEAEMLDKKLEDETKEEEHETEDFIEEEDPTQEQGHVEEPEIQEEDVEHEEEDDDEEEEDEEPPTLKYKRLTSLPVRLFSKDPVSACYFHENVYIFATHSGFIHLTKPDFTTIRTLKAHRSSVLSLHSDGEYFASGSIDGTIVIGSIYDDKEITAFDFKRPIHAVVIDKRYKNTKSFFSGGTSGNVTYSTRNWLGQRSDTIIESGNGSITTLKSVDDDLILWTNDSGISIYSITNRNKVLYIPLPSDFPRAEIYWPKIYTNGFNKIIIGWVNHIWFLSLRMEGFNDNIIRDNSNSNSNSLKGYQNNNDNKSIDDTVSEYSYTDSIIKSPSKAMSSILNNATSNFRANMTNVKNIVIESHFILEDTLISGISELDKDNIMVLNFIPPRKDKEINKRIFEKPELKIINKNTFEEVSIDEVSISGFEGLGVNDYHLEAINEGKWLLVSANDSIIVEQLTTKDRYDWFINEGKYYAAWIMSENWLSKFERLDTGIRQLDKYVSLDQWDQASNFLIQVLKLDYNSKYNLNFIKRIINEWNNWILIFTKSDKSEYIVDLIPCNNFNSFINFEEEENNFEEITDNYFEDEFEEDKFNKSYQIKEEYYNYFIEYYFKAKNFFKVIELISKWDHKLFNLQIIQNKIFNELRDFDEEQVKIKEKEDRINYYEKGIDINRFTSIIAIRKIYVEICIELDEPELCVNHLIKLKDKNIFEFLDNYNLIEKFTDKLPEIILIGIIESSEELENIPIYILKEKINNNIMILVENSEKKVIEPDIIIKIFEESKLDIINFFYLEELSKVNKLLTKKFEDEMIKLYSLYNKENLLIFLQKHNNYNIEESIKICEVNNCYKELVYLLNKIGENKNALILIIDKLNDPEYAIKFVNKINDKELWDFLLDYSMDKPDFIRILLITASKFIYDPIPIINRIPNNIEINGLNNLLIDIIYNNELELFINQLIFKIISKEVISIFENYRRLRLKGFNFEANEIFLNNTMIKFYSKISNGDDDDEDDEDELKVQANGKNKNKDQMNGNGNDISKSIKVVKEEEEEDKDKSNIRGNKTLISEIEFIGEDSFRLKFEPGHEITVSDKISHLSYIKRKLIDINANMSQKM